MVSCCSSGMVRRYTPIPVRLASYSINRVDDIIMTFEAIKWTWSNPNLIILTAFSIRWLLVDPQGKSFQSNCYYQYYMLEHGEGWWSILCVVKLSDILTTNLQTFLSPSLTLFHFQSQLRNRKGFKARRLGPSTTASTDYYYIRKNCCYELTNH